MKQPKLRNLAVPAAAAAAVFTALGCALVYKLSPHLLPVSGDISHLLGDANIDSQITVSDAVLLARYCAEDLTCGITKEGIANSDVNRDGIITIEDSAALLYLLAYGTYPPDSKPVTSETSALTADTAVTTSTASVTTSETASSASDTTDSSTHSTAVTTETTTETTETTAFTTTETTTAATEEITTTTTTAKATTLPVTTTTAPKTTAARTTTKSAVQPEAVFSAGGRALPLGVSVSDLTQSAGAVTEQFEMQYSTGTLRFSVFAEDPAHTVIAFSANNAVVGYYAVCEKYSAPNGYTVTEYTDTHPEGTGKIYAVMILRGGLSIDVRDLTKRKDLSPFAKLNYYAVNGLRAARGIPLLKWNDTGAAVALKFAKDIAEGKGNAAQHLGDGGTSTDQRLLDAGIDWCAYGENLDMGYTDPFSALNGWLRSTKGHRKPILSADYTNIGVGFVYNADSEYKIYGAQEFFKLFDE